VASIILNSNSKRHGGPASAPWLFAMETIVDDGFAQRAQNGHVFITTHDAAIGVVIDLDPASAAIFGSLASDFGGSERM
jgi:hypothetical protein